MHRLRVLFHVEKIDLLIDKVVPLEHEIQRIDLSFLPKRFSNEQILESAERVKTKRYQGPPA